MIEGAPFAVAEEEFDVLVRREHVGGIGFNEETVERDLLEGRPGLFLVLPEEIARKGEVCTEFREFRDEFCRTGIGMKEKAAGGALVGAEDLDKGSPGLEAVDREGQVVFGSQCELKRENLSLVLEL